MNYFFEFVKTEGFSLLIFLLAIVLIVFEIVNLFKINRLKKDYKILSKTLGNGEDFNKNLSIYINEVEKVSSETVKIKNNVESLKKNIEKCVQKVGLVRYKAYLESGSDLCFALALLDFEDNGVVINGIYSRDNTTTTYAKPIEHGKSKYTLVKEEEEALDRAMHSGYKYYLDIK